MERREQIQTQKIITNEMNLFESTVNRCISWTTRALEFDRDNFATTLTEEGPLKTLIPKTEKIDFKDISHLVEEYNALPLVTPSFDHIKQLYEITVTLLDKLPQFGKAVKTRNHSQPKMTISHIRRLEAEVE